MYWNCLCCKCYRNNRSNNYEVKDWMRKNSRVTSKSCMSTTKSKTLVSWWLEGWLYNFKQQHVNFIQNLIWTWRINYFQGVEHTGDNLILSISAVTVLLYILLWLDTLKFFFMLSVMSLWHCFCVSPQKYAMIPITHWTITTWENYHTWCYKEDHSSRFSLTPAKDLCGCFQSFTCFPPCIVKVVKG